MGTVIFMVSLVVYGQYITTIQPQYKKAPGADVSSDIYSVSEQRTIKRSRDSAIRVLSVNAEKGDMAASSGIYFEKGGKFYVLTTNHGLVAGCDSIQIEADGVLYDCLKILKIDPATDYAIMSVEKIENRRPLVFPKHFTRGTRDWTRTTALMNKYIYTGYPNSVGPLTLPGTVMGYTSDGHIYMLSYAWSGSSGSGVFDKRGKLAGYILAIDIGSTEYGITVLENVTIVVPIYKVDWTVLY